MQRIAIVITAVLLTTMPAWASRHPVQEATTSIDVAAAPTYPIEIIAPLRKGWHRHIHHAERKVMHHKPGPTHSVSNKTRPHHGSGGAKAAPPKEANPLERSIDLVVGLAEQFEDGLAGPEPQVITRRPYRLRGSVEVAGHSYDYVSGGAGWSIPFGDWRIDDSEGSWGRRHGALGLNDDSIPDHYIGRDRGGIEIHPNYDGRTAGCFGVEQWPAFKKAVLAMIATYGEAYLHIRPDGASVTPIKEADPFVMEAQIREEEVHHEVHHRREHLAERHRRWAHRHYAAR